MEPMQDPQNPLTPPEPSTAATPPPPPTEPTPAPETPATPNVQTAPTPDAVPGAITPPSDPITPPEQPAPVVNDQPVMSYNSMQNKRKKPLGIIIAVVAVIVLLVGSVFGLMLAANSSADSYKKAMTNQFKQEGDIFSVSTSTSDSLTSYIGQIDSFRNLIAKKPTLTPLPLGDVLSSKYKDMTALDKEITSYYAQAKPVLGDIEAYMKVLDAEHTAEASAQSDFYGAVQTMLATTKKQTANNSDVQGYIDSFNRGYEKLAADAKSNDKEAYMADLDALSNDISTKSQKVGDYFNSEGDKLKKTEKDINTKLGISTSGSTTKGSDSSASSLLKL